MANSKISVADYGASPTNTNNAVALRKAIEDCHGRKGLTLVFPPGVYHLRDEDAIELQETVMTGKFGENFERMMFFPYAPYVKGLSFAGCEDLTVQADGAVLMCDGFMEPISLERCRYVTINGLTIDYLRKPFSCGKIINRGEKHFDVKIDPAYPIMEKTPFSRSLFWNLTQNHLCRTICWPSKEYLGPQTVRLTGPVPTEAGEILIYSSHTLHFRPAILIHEAENITLNHVTIHSQPGMGIVGHRGHNITLNALKIIPSAQLHFSTNTDATHFTSCTGLLTFNECHIEGQADDSTNIHNYYQTIVQIIQKTAETETLKLRVDAPTGTHAQVLDFPDPGNILELVERETLKTVEKFQMVDVKCFPERWYCEVTIQGHLPKDIGKYYLIDATRVPQVIIQKSHFCNNAGRLLIKTRKARIEHNLFENTLGSGVFAGAEEAWKEGLTPEDIIIRNNTFINCAEAITITLSAKDPTSVGINKRITIENNIIEGNHQLGGIFISNAEDVLIRQNQVKGCNPSITLQYSQRIKAVENPECNYKLSSSVSDYYIDNNPSE